MSTPRTQKIVTTILAIYLILSPIAIGVFAYKYVHYKNLYTEYSEWVNKDVERVVDFDFRDVKPVTNKSTPQVDAIHKKMDALVDEAYPSKKK